MAIGLVDGMIQRTHTARPVEAALKDDEDEDEYDVSDGKVGRFKRITPKVLKVLVKEQSIFQVPELNDKLYLHYHGFERIEGLEAWTGLKALWLEGNGLHEIRGLDTLKQLRCLYLHQNCLKKLENLQCCPLLSTLQVNNNFIDRISGLGGLPLLSTLHLSNNHLTSADDLLGLLECPGLRVLDLQNNRLDDKRIFDVLEALPVLSVLQLQGNPVVPTLTQYRRNTIHRCRALSYLDDRPIFEEERLAVDAWAVGGLPAEREERRRQRQEKDDRHRKNLDYMLSLKKDRIPFKEDHDADDPEGDLPSLKTGDPPRESSFAKAQKAAGDEKVTEKALYDKALAALERKKCDLRKIKAERARAEAVANGEVPPPEAEDEEPLPAATPSWEESKAAPAQSAPSDALEDEAEDEVPVLQSAAKFAAQSSEDVVAQLEAPDTALPTPPPPPAAAAPDETFVPSATWTGARAGKVFKCGEQGPGYYADARAAGGTGAASGDIPSAIPTPPPAAGAMDLDELD